MAVTRDSSTRRRPPSHRYQRPRRAQPKNYQEEATDASEEEDSASSLTQSDESEDGGNMIVRNRTTVPLRNLSLRETVRQTRKSPRVTRTESPGECQVIHRKTEQTKRRAQASPRNKAPRSSRSSPTKRRQDQPPPKVSEPEGIIPDWLSPSIPYNVWTNVFIYAASDGGLDSVNTSWLRQAATTCHALKEPALAALYLCPQFKSQSKARHFVATMLKDPSETAIDYRSKVKSLYLNTQLIPQNLCSSIIQPLLALRGLVIYTPFDQPPYRQLENTLRWTYPEDLFQVLAEPRPTILKSWEWSARLVPGTLHDIARFHQTPVFSQLEKVSFINFQVPSLNLPPPKDGDEETALQQSEQDGIVIGAVAKAVSALAGLKHLVFESSTVMDHRLLPRLPDNLTHLDLINCWEIRSEDLSAFLRTSSRNLRSLSLLHCQSLSLEFLVDLAETCPTLQYLTMNLSYYRLQELFGYGDPMYDTALEAHQVPQWPPSLRFIEIEHVRDWTAEAAQMFLQSLIDQAKNLTDLRHLVIRTVLDVPWQTRASKRQEWRQKFEKVFLRRCPPPAEHRTLRPQVNSDKVDQVVGENSEPSPRKRRRVNASPPSRRSDRIASADCRRDADDGIDVPYVQGLCDVVNVMFDNQKISEVQYGMEDFWSDPDTSGEEWDGDWEQDDYTIAF